MRVKLVSAGFQTAEELLEVKPSELSKGKDSQQQAKAVWLPSVPPPISVLSRLQLCLGQMLPPPTAAFTMKQLLDST